MPTAGTIRQARGESSSNRHERFSHGTSYEKGWHMDRRKYMIVLLTKPIIRGIYILPDLQINLGNVLYIYI